MLLIVNATSKLNRIGGTHSKAGLSALVSTKTPVPQGFLSVCKDDTFSLPIIYGYE